MQKMMSCPTMGTFCYNSALSNTITQALCIAIKEQNCQPRISHLSNKRACDSQMLLFLSQPPTIANLPLVQ